MKPIFKTFRKKQNKQLLCYECLSVATIVYHTREMFLGIRLRRKKRIIIVKRRLIFFFFLIDSQCQFWLVCGDMREKWRLVEALLCLDEAQREKNHLRIFHCQTFHKTNEVTIYVNSLHLSMMMHSGTCNNLIKIYVEGNLKEMY